MGPIPDRGAKIPQAVWSGQKKKKKKTDNTHSNLYIQEMNLCLKPIITESKDISISLHHLLSECI